MSGKNFVNQFKNTRRLQARLQFGKKVKNSDLSKKKPDRNWRAGAKFPAGKEK
jgi:hypothetical protein